MLWLLAVPQALRGRSEPVSCSEEQRSMPAAHPPPPVIQGLSAPSAGTWAPPRKPALLSPCLRSSLPCSFHSLPSWPSDGTEADFFFCFFSPTIPDLLCDFPSTHPKLPVTRGRMGPVSRRSWAKAEVGLGLSSGSPEATGFPTRSSSKPAAPRAWDPQLPSGCSHSPASPTLPTGFRHPPGHGDV